MEFATVLDEELITEESRLFQTVQQDEEPELQNGANDSFSDEDTKDWMESMRTKQWIHQPSVWKLNFILFILAVAMGMIEAPLSVVLYKLACQLLTKNMPGLVCDPVQTQQIVTNFLLWNTVITAFSLVVFGPKVCQLLDIYGRKRFLLIFLVCLFVGFVLYYLIISNTTGMPVGWLWFCSFLQLAGGGSTGASSLAKAVITDLTKSRERATALGTLTVALSCGGVVGSTLSGVLANYGRKLDNPMPKAPSMPGISDGWLGQDATNQNYVPQSELLPLRVAVMLLGLVVGLMALFPESRSEKSRSLSRSASISLMNSRPDVRGGHIRHAVANFLRPLKILTFPPEFKTRYNDHAFGKVRVAVIFLNTIESMAIFVAQLSPLVGPQYAIFKFGWNTENLSSLNVGVNLLTIAALTVVLPVLTLNILPRFKFTTQSNTFDSIESQVAVFGLLLLVISFLGICLVPTAKAFTAFSLLMSGSVVTFPSVTAAITKFYPSSKSGELYGGIALAQGIVSLIAPFFLSKIYSWGVDHNFPGIAFGAGGVIVVFMILFTLVARHLAKNVKAP